MAIRPEPRDELLKMRSRKRAAIADELDNSLENEPADAASRKAAQRLWCVVTAAALAGCAAENVDRTSRGIVRGEVSAEGAWPATVTLEGCSGTLITPQVVLTAQHCEKPSRVGFGSSDRSAEWIDVVDRLGHPTTDIALLTLARPGPAEPVPVSRVTLTDDNIGDEVLIVGFGQTGEFENDGGLKREGTTAVHSFNPEEVTVGEPPGAHTCYGDSGGPYFIWWDGAMHVFGVTSYGTALCETGLAVGMRVDTNLDWIDAYVDEHDPAQCDRDARCAEGCPVVDVDCCLDTDGVCTEGCGPDLDPDCQTCEQDGYCVADCATLDTDCCIGDDGVCDELCGPELDADCAEGAPAGGDEPGGGDGPVRSFTGGCSVPGSGRSPAWLWLALAAIAAVARRHPTLGARGGR